MHESHEQMLHTDGVSVCVHVCICNNVRVREMEGEGEKEGERDVVGEGEQEAGNIVQKGEGAEGGQGTCELLTEVNQKQKVSSFLMEEVT